MVTEKTRVTQGDDGLVAAEPQGAADQLRRVAGQKLTEFLITRKG